MDKSHLHALLKDIDPLDDDALLHKKLDAVMRALSLLLRLRELEDSKMSALTDTLLGAIDRLAAKVAEASSTSEAIANLQAQKAALEQQFQALQAQLDEQNAAIQAAIDKANAVAP